MHDRTLPQRRMMMVSADLQPYQNGSDGLVFILMGPVGLNYAIFLSSDGHTYTSCCAADSYRMDPYTHQRMTYAITGRK